MKLRYDQLSYHLGKTLAPCYLVAGDELLFVNEACSAIRQTAAQGGYTDRMRFFVESGFNWQQFLGATQNFSLFAEQQFLELWLPAEGKLDETGREAIATYLKNPGQDKVLLIRSPKLDATAQKAAWYKAVEEVGVVVQIFPISREQLPAWIKQRLQLAKINTTLEIAELLAERVEGNLLAAAQEIEKLTLLIGEGTLDHETLMEVVGDSARFDVYTLVDTAMLGDAAKAIRILAQLRAEGLETPIILWALTREIRALAGMSNALAQGQNLGQVFNAAGVWEKRKPIVQKALQRKPAPNWLHLLVQAANIDRMIKGVAAGRVWDELQHITVQLAGVKLH